MYTTIDTVEKYKEFVANGRCVMFFFNGQIDKIHRLVYEAYPLMAYLNQRKITSYAVVYGNAYKHMAQTQNIISPVGVALFDDTKACCAFGSFDNRVVGDYIDCLFDNDPVNVGTVVDMSGRADGKKMLSVTTAPALGELEHNKVPPRLGRSATKRVLENLSKIQSRMLRRTSTT
ncbi:hypothetical protein GGI25_001986 [Coemansia spiralis]|uniref:Uncharacterized protein n=2 Tax=Coemansia TaxID=4863 RepID=A0A9W8G9H3_9FUNG|nr:hypothetical protein BX070DRAFT_236338 [Coemansia spiralis]KAJ1986569.1 hypothetical protein EDC05_006236 [Coemansia umbellata]KAJ2623242.1 hypothetical protein GGI26_002469 [Coemansia sp. RSA 1358]KAJ2678794.1 hypothetical protein GGI25_001986 [Coemansia spiralis]